MARKRVLRIPIILTGATPAPARRKTTTTTRASRAAAAAAAEVSAPEEVHTTIVPAEPMPEVISAEAASVPTYQEIAGLAYSYWVERGHQGGSAEEDWLRAERELSVK